MVMDRTAIGVCLTIATKAKQFFDAPQGTQAGNEPLYP